MARALHIVIRRHAWNYDISAFSQLLGASQHDFGVTVVVLNCALNFDLTSLKLAYVAHFFYVGREYDHRKGAACHFLAKTEESRALPASFDVHHCASDTLIGSHMFTRVSE